MSLTASDISGNGLKRDLGLFSATCVVVANMIGAGIFMTSGYMAAQLPGPLWVLGCWMLGGLIAASGALCYAELATRLPKAGGEYVYLHAVYGPLPAFLTGWTSLFVGFSAATALSAFGFMEYLGASLEHIYSVDAFLLVLIKKLGAIFIIAVFTLLHYLGLRFGSRVQNSLTVLKIAILLALVGAGLAFGSGSWEGFTRSFAAAGGWAFGSSMLLVMYAFSGWNATAYIASELRSPRRTLPTSLLLGTAIVTLLYLAVNVLIFYLAPYDLLKGQVAVVEKAAVAGLGNWMADVLSGLIGIAMLSSLSAYLLIGPRVYYAMARDRLFFSFAGRVHPRHRVPGLAILVQAAIAVGMVIVGSVEQLLIYVGFALGIFPWLAVLGLFLARRRGLGENDVYKVWGYPLIPFFYLFASAALMIFALLEKPLESAAAMVTIALGIPFYYIWSRGFGKNS
jgi:APA family basic amino acid/polyamine antiporter